QSIQEAEATLVKLTGPLVKQEEFLTQNLAGASRLHDKLTQTPAADQLPGLSQPLLLDRLKALQQAASAELPTAQSLLNRDWIDTAPVEANLEQIQAVQQASNRLLEYLHDPSQNTDRRSARDQVIQERDRRERLVSQLEAQVDRTNVDIESLAARTDGYPD